MLNELLIPLRDYFGFLNLFEYITFRAGASAILALLISFIFGPFVVRKLINLQIGEEKIKSQEETMKRLEENRDEQINKFKEDIVQPVAIGAGGEAGA